MLPAGYHAQRLLAETICLTPAAILYPTVCLFEELEIQWPVASTFEIVASNLGHCLLINYTPWQSVVGSVDTSKFPKTENDGRTPMNSPNCSLRAQWTMAMMMILTVAIITKM